MMSSKLTSLINLSTSTLSNQKIMVIFDNTLSIIEILHQKNLFSDATFMIWKRVYCLIYHPFVLKTNASLLFSSTSLLLSPLLFSLLLLFHFSLAVVTTSSFQSSVCMLPKNMSEQIVTNFHIFIICDCISFYSKIYIHSYFVFTRYTNKTYPK